MMTNKINSITSFKTAVLFLVFNRIDTTTKAFEEIRRTRPAKLYIAGDGPREENDEDIEKVKKVREIATRIDWPCEVKTLFRDENLGCKEGVSSAITWFFAHEERGIILEDDCVPHLDFFTFCESLLIRYAEDERVSVITGNNFQQGIKRGDASYYVSKYNHCWGWASWRRSWKDYQGDIKFWPKWKKSKDWLNYIPDRVERKYWENIFENVYLNKIDSWAYPWTCCNWRLGKISIAPNVNLVKNIGFEREDATHTKSKHISSNLEVYSMDFIKHPKHLKVDLEADLFDFNCHFGGKKLRFPFFLVIFIKNILHLTYNKFKKFK